MARGTGRRGQRQCARWRGACVQISSVCQDDHLPSDCCVPCVLPAPVRCDGQPCDSEIRSEFVRRCALLIGLSSQVLPSHSSWLSSHRLLRFFPRPNPAAPQILAAGAGYNPTARAGADCHLLRDHARQKAPRRTLQQRGRQEQRSRQRGRQRRASCKTRLSGRTPGSTG